MAIRKTRKSPVSQSFRGRTVKAATKVLLDRQEAKPVDGVLLESPMGDETVSVMIAPRKVVEVAKGDLVRLERIDAAISRLHVRAGALVTLRRELAVEDLDELPFIKNSLFLIAQYRFAMRADDKGWLKVKIEGIEVSLIEYSKVQFLERKNGRDHFTVSEGVYAGKSGSVVAKGASESWLGSPLPSYKAAAMLEFSKSAKKLSTPIGDFTAISEDTPIANGTHKIQLPDFPHSKGESYLSKTKAALNWFHLGEGNAVPQTDANYLHPGAGSLGCITVTEVEKWTQLYNYLVLCRSSESGFVGTVKVSD